jgi:hypothetical protein
MVGLPASAIYVGRPSRWGNPYHMTHGRTREQAIELYEVYLRRAPGLLADLHELRGRDLVCWCAPKACHADVLLRLANAGR